MPPLFVTIRARLLLVFHERHDDRRPHGSHRNDLAFLPSVLLFASTFNSITDSGCLSIIDPLTTHHAMGKSSFSHGLLHKLMILVYFQTFGAPYIYEVEGLVVHLLFLSSSVDNWKVVLNEGGHERSLSSLGG